MLEKLKTTTAGGAIIIAFFSIISRLFGLIRDRLLASSFGAGDVLDSYYAAFRLPDLIFNTLILGALASAFIPVFLDLYRKNEKESWQVANSVMNVLLVALIIFGIVFFIFTPQLVSLIAPGFDLEKRAATAGLTRIMLLAMLFFGASNVVSGVLQAFKRFVAFSIAPIMYNIGIIVGILALVPLMGISGLAWGVVLGAALHFLIQLPAVLKAGFHYQFSWQVFHPSVKKIIKLMLPRTFGLAVLQVNQIIITAIASTLMIGSVAVFNLALNLQSVPIGLFGVSMALAAFPVLTESFVENNREKFVVSFSMATRRILYLIIPVSVLILLLRAQIVRIVLGAGMFDWQDTILTLQTLGFFSLSLFAQALIPLAARSFYAHQDTKTPVIISVICLIINTAAAFYFASFLGVGGLALAYSVASILNLILLYVILRARFGSLDDKKILNSLIKISIASILMAVVAQGVKYFVGGLVDMQTFLGVFLQTAVAGLIGVLFYFFITAFLFRLEEVRVIKEWIFNRIR